jgi:hypothetical protein
VQQALRRALGLYHSDMSVFDAGPIAPTSGWHRCYTQSWPRVRELRIALESAIREAGHGR